MKIGLCSAIENAALAKSAGCDYIELGFSGIARQSADDFAKTKRLLAQAGIPCEAMNGFIPADFALASPGLDIPALEAYLRQGFARARELGAQVVVFGSSKARRLPEGMDKQTGWEILAPIHKIAGDCAASYHIAVAVEPLCPAECNAVNTLRDGLDLMKQAAHSHVKLLADMYHIAENNEDFADILLAGDDLRHCHIACPGTRKYPMPGDGYHYAPFFHALRVAGYAGRVSIEAKTENMAADLPVAVNFLRGLIN
jgi:sugar phosphate isomerase/epimerase